MIHEQDNIKYTIEDNLLKGFIGESPFKKPIWNGEAIVEGWNSEDEAAYLDSLIPKYISKLNFKIGLLTNHNITNAHVQAFFDTLQDPLQVAQLELLWFESTFFERKDPNLVEFAPALGLTVDDVNEIFINFNGYN